MDYIIQEIEMIVQILKIQKQNYTLKLRESPPGGLIRTFIKRRPVYMHSVPDGKYPNGAIKYRKERLNENHLLLRQLALKEYLRIALKILDHNVRCLENAKTGLLPLTFEAVRAQMRKPYQAVSDNLLSAEFLEGMTLSGEGCFLFQQKWAAESFEQSKYHLQDKIHRTSRGLAVRSRAELLIAEKLYQYGIPFRYEQVIHAGKYELAPDFTFLDYNHKEFYWEYAGMMGVPKYQDHQLWRRGMYESIGISEWTNMIYTYDAADSIDMREIEAIIKSKILPRMQENPIR